MIFKVYLKVFMAICLSSIIMILIDNKIFNAIPFIYDEFVYLKKYQDINPSFYSEKLIALRNLSRSIKSKSVVVIANPECRENEEIKNFSYSALLEARIWNECHMYNKKTKGGMYNIVNMFKDINFDKKEDSKVKYEIAFNFANNDNVSRIECASIISEHGWSYMLVDKDKIIMDGSCLANRKHIKEGNYILYEF